MNLRLTFTILTTRIVSFLLKILNKGSGTALPGLIAQKIYPNALEALAKQIDRIIVISGTNGKTTTQTLLGSILQESGIKIIQNKSGSNMKRGLLSILMKKASLFGKIKEKAAIFEIEEATLPKIIDSLKPEIIIVTNLFRDQLDAYGEVDRTQKFIREAIELSPQATLILNGDDPRVSRLSENLKNKTIYYGLDSKFQIGFKYEGQISAINNSNIIKAHEVVISQKLETEFKVGKKTYKIQPLGKFQVYNALAAILASNEIGITEDSITNGLANAKPAFGRGEVIEKNGISYKTLLVKNPAGMNLTLNVFKEISTHPVLMFILNDNLADGRDVSWIWDSDFEVLNQTRPKLILVSGERAEDMLLRIKYAVGPLTKISKGYYKYSHGEIIMNKDLNKIETELKSRIKEELIFVLPTYTAMLSFRKYLLGNAINEQ